MDRKELDRLLTGLPSVIKGNQSSLSFTEEMREAVHQRISDWGNRQQERTNRSSFILSSAAVFIVFLLLGGITALLSGKGAHNGSDNPLFTQIESMIVDLDGEGAPEMVNTWKIQGAGQDAKLVALIWARDSENQWQVVSSEPMDGVEFLPLEVLKPEQQKGHLVVISAARGQDNVVYRVMGYNGREVLPFLERSLNPIPQRERFIQEIESLLPATYVR